MTEKTEQQADDRSTMLITLNDQYRLRWEKQREMIKSSMPLTEAGTKVAVRTARSFLLPLHGIDMIPVGKGGQMIPYVNAEGIRFKLWIDPRGYKSADCDVIHWPTKDEPWVVVKGKVEFADGSTYQNFGAVDCQPGPGVSNAILKATCVPLHSEILTRDGFKKYHEVSIGDDVLAYDIYTDTCLWTPLLDITVHDSLPKIRIYTPQGRFEIFCSPDHSWAVQRSAPYKPDHRGNGSRGARGPYKNRGQLRILLPIQQIKTSHRLVLSAPVVDNDDIESPLTPTEAALLGWVITDGTIKNSGDHVRLGISQSKEENFDAIREIVYSIAPSAHESVSASGYRTFPISNKTYAQREQHWWYIPVSISRELLRKAGYSDRCDLPRLASRLSHNARVAMLNAMMRAEGTGRGEFINTDRDILETFQMLCIFEGIAVGEEHSRQPDKKYKAWVRQRMKKTRHINGWNLRWEMVGAEPMWCPTTALGTWVMRQNRRVTITGNTKAYRRAGISAVGVALPIAEEYYDYVDEQRQAGKPVDAIDAEYREAQGKPIVEPKNLSELLVWVDQVGHTIDEAVQLAGEYTVMAQNIPATVKKLKETWRIT